ncbi:innexin inx2-like [Panonychus citri]|uniref:innexin inx2-like n=1 Tax=Panonychus citri TaxID=50023 RepID=UPI00230779D1|nr:innexin inx2-like [Panonychus citri]XP_053207229.1 innexin inx2-like [Panonychus citri]
MVATGALIGLLGTKLKFLGKIKPTTIDNTVFKLHYRWTVNMLLVACAVVTSTQFFGDPITCIKSESFINSAIINNYCWIEGTFTLPRALTKVAGTEVALPGIEKTPVDATDMLIHKYYQWVWWVLFLQAMSFYVTRLIWKSWENGIVARLINNLNQTILQESKKKEHSSFLVDFLSSRRGTFDHYAKKFLFCEILNLTHVIVQIIITDTFLGGNFLDYGALVLAYSGDPEETNPMTKVFPKMTKCTFRVYGSSGDIQIYDNFCLLPLNIINEKIYLFLWIWFIFLAAVSALSVIHRIVSFVYPPCRHRLLQMISRRAKPEAHSTLIESLNYGDWFLLYLIGQNVEQSHFAEVLELFALQLDEATLPKAKKISESSI